MITQAASAAGAAAGILTRILMALNSTYLKMNDLYHMMKNWLIHLQQ
jgi:hypothetical protein